MFSIAAWYKMNAQQFLETDKVANLFTAVVIFGYNCQMRVSTMPFGLSFFDILIHRDFQRSYSVCTVERSGKSCSYVVSMLDCRSEELLILWSRNFSISKNGVRMTNRLCSLFITWSINGKYNARFQYCWILSCSGLLRCFCFEDILGTCVVEFTFDASVAAFW